VLTTIAMTIFAQLDAGSGATMQVFFYAEKTATATSCFRVATDGGELSVRELEHAGPGNYTLKTSSDGGEFCVEVTSRGARVSDTHGAIASASGSAVLTVAGVEPPAAGHRETGTVSASHITIGGKLSCSLLALTTPFIGTQQGSFETMVVTTRGSKGVEQVTLVSDDQASCSFEASGDRFVSRSDCSFPVGGGEVRTAARCPSNSMKASFTPLGRLRIEATRCEATVPETRHTPLAGCKFGADLLVEIAP
jgi:hypothetical protein